MKFWTLLTCSLLHFSQMASAQVDLSDAIYSAIQAVELVTPQADGTTAHSKTLGGMTCTRSQAKTKCEIDPLAKDAKLIYANLHAFESILDSGVETGVVKTTKQVGHLFCTQESDFTTNEALSSDCYFLH